MAKPDKPLPSLDKLQQEIDEARGLKPEESHDSTQPGAGLSQAMRMGVDLVAGVLVGGGFGYFVDRWLGTMPIFFVICFFLGAAAGFKNMLRDAKKVDETENEKE